MVFKGSFEFAHTYALCLARVQSGGARTCTDYSKPTAWVPQPVSPGHPLDREIDTLKLCREVLGEVFERGTSKESLHLWYRVRVYQQKPWLDNPQRTCYGVLRSCSSVDATIEEILSARHLLIP